MFLPAHLRELRLEGAWKTVCNQCTKIKSKLSASCFLVCCDLLIMNIWSISTLMFFRLRINNQRFGLYPPTYIYIYIFPQLSVEKIWKRSKKWSESVPLVINPNNPMTQEWIDLPLTSESKSVPMWNVNIAICFQTFNASSYVLHANTYCRFPSDGWCLSPGMEPFRTVWACSSRLNGMFTSFMREECIQMNQTCVTFTLIMTASRWLRAFYSSGKCADVMQT